MRIGLISDTHGRFDPRLAELLAGCARILHAGDVVGEEVFRSLEAIAPTAAVRGNNDRDPWGASLPEAWVDTIAGVRVLVIHALGKPAQLLPAARRAIEAADPRLVVYGHSHVPAIETRDGRLFVNPGSAGPRRFRLPRSAGILELGEGTATIRILDLEDRGRQDLPAPTTIRL